MDENGWYKVKKNVYELLEFLMNAELITDKEGVIDLITKPYKYTEVWVTYQYHILGEY